MKKLLFCLFLFLIFCNVGYAETYVCKDDETITTVETSIWERHSKYQFTLKLINNDRKIYFDIFHEDQNAIILIYKATNSSGIAVMMLNKSDLSYGGSQIFYPFDNDENSDFTFGKCDKIN